MKIHRIIVKDTRAIAESISPGHSKLLGKSGRRSNFTRQYSLKGGAKAAILGIINGSKSYVTNCIPDVL